MGKIYLLRNEEEMPVIGLGRLLKGYRLVGYRTRLDFESVIQDDVETKC